MLFFTREGVGEVKKVLIIGGGMAGCAAAIAACKKNAEVTIFEKTDRLGGLSQVAGTFGANAQLTAMEEAIIMGATEIPGLLKSLVIHSNVKMPGKEHVSLYDCRRFSEGLHRTVEKLGIEVRCGTRFTDIEKEGDSIKAITVDNGERIEAEAFVDATGTSGPMENCKKYGNGCVDCPQRCPTFGGRISPTACAGVVERVGLRNDGRPGSYTAAFTLVKETMSSDIQAKLEEDGSILYPVPFGLINELRARICFVPTSVTSDYAEKLTLEDNGYMNVIGIPWLTLNELRQLPGFERAAFVQPYTGWVGNAIRYMAVAPRDVHLRVKGIANLFVAGDKVGGQPNGVTEAFITGTVAGHNAARVADGDLSLERIPESTAIGDFLAFTDMKQGDMASRHTFMWGPYFERLKEKGLYTVDLDIIRRRVASAEMTGVFCR